MELERIRAERKQKMSELQDREGVLSDLRTEHEMLKQQCREKEAATKIQDEECKMRLKMLD